MRKALEIGVTGGIGSGKSLVCHIFSSLRIPVYSADDRAKSLMNEDSELRNQIKTAFGEQSYLEGGNLDRAYLAKLVFSDQKKVKQLNALVHPAVRSDYKRWSSTKQKYPYLIREAALMIESGIYKDLDYLIHVKAPEDLRVQRIEKRDPQRSREEIKNIISNQLSDRDRDEKSDFVISNSEKTLLIPQVLELHKVFIKLQRGA
ncbi:MAG: dephospho-CoA kinase [Bacteroidota bacterium]